jgi:tRNA U34 5-methylaminomethyl-2-thiouridine-forming methyltransferase MnmC
MLARKIFITSDGSTSIHIPEWNEHYHSKHGAIQEAYHVFIKNGLEYFRQKNISILEIGLGTGLNCFITFLETQKRNLDINYTGIEAFPIKQSEEKQLNYVEQLNASEQQSVFHLIHNSNWEKSIALSKIFTLTKHLQKFQTLTENNRYNLIYFDAFGPRVQPELWTENIFQKMFDALLPKGILVTYSAKGSVRRAMQQVGFIVERLEGPSGKREMLRALKK